jgi:hypothetical protein
MSTLHHHVLNAQPRETYAASISSFMRWAQERIAKEVEENERVEPKLGQGISSLAQVMPRSRTTPPKRSLTY